MGGIHPNPCDSRTACVCRFALLGFLRALVRSGQPTWRSVVGAMGGRQVSHAREIHGQQMLDGFVESEFARCEVLTLDRGRLHGDAAPEDEHE